MTETGQVGTMWARNRATIKFTLVDKTVTPNVPLALSGKVLKFTMSKVDPSTGEFSSKPKVEKKSSVPSEITITETVDETTAEVALTGADTDGFSGDFEFQLEVFDAGGVDLDGVMLSEGVLTLNKNMVNT